MDGWVGGPFRIFRVIRDLLYSYYSGEKKGEKKNDLDNYTIPSHTEFMDIERLNGTAASLRSARRSDRRPARRSDH